MPMTWKSTKPWGQYKLSNYRHKASGVQGIQEGSIPLPRGNNSILVKKNLKLSLQKVSEWKKKLTAFKNILVSHGHFQSIIAQSILRYKDLGEGGKTFLPF